MSFAIKVRCSRHECVVSLKLLEPKGKALHIRAVKNLNARRVFLYLNTRLCGIQYLNKSNKSNSGAKNNRYADWIIKYLYRETILSILQLLNYEMVQNFAHNYVYLFLVFKYRKVNINNKTFSVNILYFMKNKIINSYFNLYNVSE